MKQLMTIVLECPVDEVQLESYRLGLEVLWPFQIWACAGDATINHDDQRKEGKKSLSACIENQFDMDRKS
ncbi:hypothetical protein [Comamonas terrigena]|uniref:hypothetical protein n=1 Tax=Comamonas terrigena TaxID=32013 RepID=UPI0024497907|nr:hypothetical protein [Comamonas terrigena]MDH0051469.1 hypothetical protein [Comamonas terrigena]MDH0513843.1 hypothetical protein [Comamonas terrigena]MDH1093416.1 hypothetical protein [Comamonas terrigena]